MAIRYATWSAAQTLRRRSTGVAVLLLCGWLAAPPPAAAKMYKWVDEEGRVHYSDRVPPHAVRQQRSVLDEHGIEVERTERARTAEEIARQEELERLRGLQRQLREEQEERDRVLLNTFRTEGDLVIARDRKLEVIDTHISLTEANIRRLKNRLSQMQASAAATERQGEQVSPTFKAEIEATRRQIEDGYASILQREQERKDIRAAFDADQARLRELRHLKTTAEEDQEPPNPRRLSLLDTLVQCDTPQVCARYWERAGAYARERATTKLQLTGERILLTAPPQQDNDISITVSRIPEQGGIELIFMDVQCRTSPFGTEHCRGPGVAEVRAGFKGFVTGADPPATPAPQ